MIYLKEIRENNDFIRKLLKCGYLATKMMYHKDIVERHNAYIRQGLPRCQAAENTAIDFNCSVSTIYNALKRISI